MAASSALKSVCSKANDLVLGICIPCLKHNASKFRVQHLELDKHLLMFFKRFSILYAHDPDKICKTGDVVLIKKLPQNMTTSISHKVLKVIFPHGDMIDPVTSKAVVGIRYRDELTLEDEVFGKNKDAFEYQKAPKRGWQEESKDFSHRQVYLQYHEFDENDENSKQPWSSKYV